MCQFCSEANERMEPTDDKLIGPSSEDHVGSSTSHSVISEQGTIEQGDFSSSEVFLARSAVSLRNINSFASNCSKIWHLSHSKLYVATRVWFLKPCIFFLNFR